MEDAEVADCKQVSHVGAWEGQANGSVGSARGGSIRSEAATMMAKRERDCEVIL